MNIFDIMNDISNGKEVKFSREEIEEHYNQFFVMDCFSKFEDSIFITNEINSFKSSLSKYDHYLYLHSTMRKRSRRISCPSKKIAKDEGNLLIIMNAYDYSREKAKVAMRILTEDQIQSLIQDVGGVLK